MKIEATTYRSARFRVEQRSHAASGGATITKDTIQHPGAVAIVPCLDDDRVCLIRNYRIAVDQTLIEVPAGTLEPGEDPANTARRELTEETGYSAESIQPLGRLSMSPGILNETMHVFVATGLAPGSAARELGEEIENLVVSWNDAIAMIRRGEICDAKSVAALLWYDRFGRADVT